MGCGASSTNRKNPDGTEDTSTYTLKDFAYELYTIGTEFAREQAETAKKKVHESSLAKYLPERFAPGKPPAPPAPVTHNVDEDTWDKEQERLRQEREEDERRQREEKQAREEQMEALRRRREAEEQLRAKQEDEENDLLDQESNDREWIASDELMTFQSFEGDFTSAKNIVEAAALQRAAQEKAAQEAEEQHQLDEANNAIVELFKTLLISVEKQEEQIRSEHDQNAMEGFEHLGMGLRTVAAQIEHEERRKQEALKADRATEERRKKEAEKRELLRQRQEAERKKRQEEAAMIAAAKAEEKERLQKEAAEAQRRRAEEEQRRKEEEEREKEQELQKRAEEARQKRQNMAIDDVDPMTESDGEDLEIKPQPTMEGAQNSLMKDIDVFLIKNTLGPKEKWAFFNGTLNRELCVTWTFGPSSDITVLGKTTRKVLPDKWIECKDTIYPGQTNLFMEGKANGFKSSYTVKGISAEYKQQMADERKVKIDGEIKAVRSLGANLSEEERLAACVKQGIPYVDLDFLPSQDSLARKGDKRNMAEVPWARPQWYLPNGIKPRLIKHKIDPNDIDQGALGDCWFLCSVSALAEFPDKVDDTFAHPHPEKARRAAALRKEQKVGAFRVCINKSGWWHNYIVDSFIPAVASPQFAKNVEEPNELWVSLLEKAYAKAHGSYSAIVSGDSTKAMQDLTGFPCRRFDNEMGDKSQRAVLFKKLQSWDNSGYLLTVSCPGSESKIESKYERVGLVTGHAYTLLRVVTVASKNIRLCQIRNPWGNDKEWNGAWSDKDAMWSKHPDVKKECGHIVASDGTFWMAWDDVCEYFDGGGVCFMRTGWHDYRVRAPIKNGYPEFALLIHVKTPVSVFLTMSQPCTRANPKHEQAAIQLCLGEAVKGKKHEYEYTHYSTNDPEHPAHELSSYTYTRDICIQTRLKPTKSSAPYVVVAREYDHKATFDAVLGVIASNPIDDASFKVEFRAIASSSRAFENYPTFEMNVGSMGSVKTDFQTNNDHGAPVTKNGTCIS